MRLFISNGIWIPRDFPAIGEVMRELSFVNPQYEKVQKMGYWAGNVPTEYCCWRAEGDYIVVPLGYKKQIHIKCQKLGISLEFEDHRCSKEGVSLEFNGTLRDYQEEAVERMKIFSNGVLVAPAGSGKTVVALRLIADLKLRTLVLVHTKDIMIQWRDRINEFLDYEPGFIGAGSQDYNEGITIATFQTLNKRINDFDYGLVIADEVHHVAASTFSYVVQQFYPSKLYGLTATPERADHLEEFYYSIIGPIIHKIKDDALIERGVKIIPEVYKIYTDFHGQLRGNNWQNFYSRVAEDESRNEIIIQNAIREPDNYHLILSKRVQHCIDLHEKLNQHGMRAGLCIGSMGKEERQSNLNAMRNGQLHFLVATSQLADEALDIPILDRLHIGIPTAFSGRVIQQIGRIQRPHPHKQNAIIYDYYDEQSDVLCTLYNKRYWQIYRKNGFPIREIRDFQNNY